MRLQPEIIINMLEADNSRLAKEKLIGDLMNDDYVEFFVGVKWCLDKLHTFGVKQVPIKEVDEGQGLPWNAFCQLAEQLVNRALTGHAARDAIKLCMDAATQAQWNDWYRRILIKDLRCGVSEKTVNNVAKKLKRDEYKVPVFTCQLAHDSAKHEAKVKGKKIIQKKLDGIRALCVIDWEHKDVTMWTRNGKQLHNFNHICNAIKEHIDLFARSYVLDGEIMSDSFQTLMKQVHRKSDVDAVDAVLNIFDIIPLFEFKRGESTMGQIRRSLFLNNEFKTVLDETGCCHVVPWDLVDLDTEIGQEQFKNMMAEAVEAGYEGIMIKDPDATYQCKRSVAWLKMKPFIEVSLAVIAIEEGTGRNAGRLGAFVCFGKDDGKTIKVNVGSGFSDEQREQFWNDKDQIIDQIAEIRADAITQNQNEINTWSLRFPRFLHFRGFEPGEKI